MTDHDSETYSEEETKARAEAALKRMLATPHKKQADTKSTGKLKRGRPKGDGRSRA